MNQQVRNGAVEDDDERFTQAPIRPGMQSMIDILQVWHLLIGNQEQVLAVIKALQTEEAKRSDQADIAGLHAQMRQLLTETQAHLPHLHRRLVSMQLQLVVLIMMSAVVSGIIATAGMAIVFSVLH